MNCIEFVFIWIAIHIYYFLGIRLADKGSNGVANCRGQNTIVFGVLKVCVVVYYCPVEHLNIIVGLDLFAA